MVKGRFVIRGLELLQSPLYQKSAHQDGKSNEKCRSWGGFVGLGCTQGHQQHNYSMERIPLFIQI